MKKPRCSICGKLAGANASSSSFGPVCPRCMDVGYVRVWTTSGRECQ